MRTAAVGGPGKATAATALERAVAVVRTAAGMERGKNWAGCKKENRCGAILEKFCLEGEQRNGWGSEVKIGLLYFKTDNST